MSSTRYDTAYCKMSGLTARVALAGLATAAQTKSWAVRLDVTKALAVVALLGLGGPWVRASRALVAWLLAVVAQALAAGANLGIVADVAALVAGTALERRHLALDRHWHGGRCLNFLWIHLVELRFRGWR